MMIGGGGAGIHSSHRCNYYVACRLRVELEDTLWIGAWAFQTTVEILSRG